jgi:hypothetical protein
MHAACAAAAAWLMLTAAARHGHSAESAPAADPTVGSISGSVRFDGKAPEGERFDLTPAEKPLCGAFKRALPFEVGKGGGVRGAVVFLTGAPAATATTLAALPEAVTLNMRACEWTPQVSDATVGQALALANQDAAALQPELRWRAADPGPDEPTRPRTLYVPGKGQQIGIARQSAGIVDVDCLGCRSWSQAEVHVFDHPWHDTSDERGAFEIHGIPPGTYTLVARVRTLGDQTATVTVVAGQTAEVQFRFTPGSASSAPAEANGGR